MVGDCIVRNKVIVGFALVLSVLVIDDVLSWWNIEQLIERDYWVVHTYKVISELEGVLADATTAERSQRGFLLLGIDGKNGPDHNNVDYLEMYREADVRVQDRLRTLVDLTRDRKSQQDPLAILQKQVETRRAEIEPILVLRKDRDLAATLDLLRSDKGDEYLSAVQKTVQSMRNVEEKLLQDRAQEAKSSVQLTRLTFWSGAIISVALLGIAYVLVMRDFTQRKRAAELIRQEREWLEVTFQGIGDGVIATDARGRVILLNPVAQELTGWRQEEAVGRPVTEVFRIINEETRLSVLNPAVQALEANRIIELGNHTLLIARDGTERPIDDSGGPIRSAKGRVIGAVLIFRDVSDARERRKERDRLLEREQDARTLAEASKAQLAEAAHRKDNFLALLGHELRNPLAPIRNAVAILGCTGANDTNIVQARDMIDRQVRHLTRMVDELLDASRIANGKIQLRRERLDLARLVRAAAEDHRIDLESSGLTLEVMVPTSPVWVEGDSVRLTQIVSNLLMNSGKFTDSGGRIAVCVTQNSAEQQATVVVRDTGVGMEQALLEQLFQPFEQADRSLDRSRGGLGLGLAVVRGLVELHAGAVRASSEGPGKGSEFTFWMPLAEEPPVVASADPPAAPAVAGALRILIIEDNKDAADSLRMLLELSGKHEVTVVYTGPAGVDSARTFRPHVVLCDLGLPGLSGFEVAQVLRGNAATSSMRLIAVSGYGHEEARRKAHEAGFDQILIKPIDFDALLRLLAVALL